MGLDNQAAEIQAWASFAQLRLIFKSEMTNILIRKVFDTCDFPVVAHGAEMC